MSQTDNAKTAPPDESGRNAENEKNLSKGYTLEDITTILQTSAYEYLNAYELSRIAQTLKLKELEQLTRIANVLERFERYGVSAHTSGV